MSKGLKKRSVSMDMTAMCDMAFLLLTFFILTAQMKPKEPVAINLPGAHQSDTTPVKNTIRISIESGGAVYLSIGDKQIREHIITSINDYQGMGLNEDQIHAFTQINMFGFPFSKAKESIDNLNNDSFKQEGIPIDTTGGELKIWLVAALAEYEYDPSLLPKGVKNPTIAIHADKNLPYKDVKKVLEIVQSDGIKIDGFKLITNLE